MSPPTVLVPLAEGFEEIEVVTPIDLLRRAGASVTTAALGDGIHVKGRNGLVVHADTTLSALGSPDFDCVFIPGGPGVAALRSDARVADILRRQDGAGRWIASICAGPLVLKVAGILRARRHTAHFSAAQELPAALLGERVVSDGNLVTSRGAGTALELGLAMVERLFSREKADEVARSVSA
jgi:4-methyl-5(b-hydroxyethyl)-thiazole monophosphate biosynthesis